MMISRLAARARGGSSRLHVRSLSSAGTLYTHRGIPSPDIVHMYLAEAGATDLVSYESTNVNSKCFVTRTDEPAL